MKAACLTFKEFGNPQQVLTIEYRNIQPPKHHEVLVRMIARPINHLTSYRYGAHTLIEFRCQTYQAMRESELLKALVPRYVTVSLANVFYR